MSSFIPRLQHRTLLLCALVLVVLCLAPLQAVRAMPAQQDAPRPLLLGEFGSATLAEGEAVQFALTTPFDGAYTVAFTADGDPGDFLLTLTDADGNELYNDALQTDTIVDLTCRRLRTHLHRTNCGRACLSSWHRSRHNDH
jgi:hypothetical protein